MIRDLIIARLFLTALLAFITYQVVMLRRMMPSSAWTLLALGFGAHLLVNVFVLLGWLEGVTRTLCSIGAYALIGFGFNELRVSFVALRGLTHNRRSND